MQRAADPNCTLAKWHDNHCFLFCEKMSWISDTVFVDEVVKAVTFVRFVFASTIFSLGVFEKILLS